MLRAADLAALNEAWQAAAPADAPGDGVLDGQSAAPSAWFVTRVDAYRDPMAYLPALTGGDPLWSLDWGGVRVRAYTMRAFGPPDSAEGAAPGVEVPDWLLNWPSPLADSCRE